MNYLDQMKEDILDYIREEGITVTSENRKEVEEELNDKLWYVDSVTGNASGSYTFDNETAKKYVVENMDVLKEMVMEFDIDAKTVAEKFINEEWEYFDVSIRCYLLGSAIAAAIDEEIEYRKEVAN